MKKTTFSNYFGVSSGLKGLKVLMTISLFTFFATQFNSLNAQPCTLGCFDDQVSLGEGCEGEITAEMVSNTSGVCTPLTVIVYDENFVEIPTSPIVTGDYLGRTLNVGVWDELSNNCWSEILILDKMRPTIDCGDTLYMSCLEMAMYPGPEASDNCEAYGSAPTVLQVGESVNPLPCDPDYIKEITRSYIAIDDSGNVSLDTCTQVIRLERFDMTLVDMPDDFTVLDGTALACDGNYPLDGEGHPHPSYTGAPEVNGVPIWPLGDFYCNINIVYNDFELPAAGCVEKIMRTWTVYEWWCSQEIDTSYVQLIEIADTEGPEVTCPPDVTLTTDGDGSCVATYVLPAATAFDNCNNPVTWSVVYPGGVTNTNGGITVELGAGHNEIVYTAYDNCYLSNSCTLDVYVEDNTPPVAICDQNTVVSLTSNGLADVYWHTFDDGSYDDCGILKIEVRRMNNNCGIAGWNVFKEYVTFCCNDVGTGPHVVEMKVTDLALNTNTCMVNVTVQDKLPPSITCPPAITIDCEYPYDLDNLWEFGKVVTNGQPDSIFVNGVFKGMDGEAYDNCEVTVNHTSSANIGDCGTGTITRVFRATGPGGVDAVCAQVIKVENNDPFNGNDPADLSWPPNYTAYDVCETNGLDPDDLPAPYGWPVINEDACDLVGISWSDMVFNIIDPNEEACMKILRMWKVIDWCDFQNNEYTIYTHTQIIKVHNTMSPWFTSSCADVEVESFDPNCGGTYVELIQTGDDDCTPINLLAWSYRIDVDNDGVFDGVPGHTNDASAVYPVGTHRIVWTVEDLCGNTETCTQLVTVFNDKPPTPYVYNGLAIDIMPVQGGGMVEIWASDFDAGSYHACGYDITLSFSSDPTDQSVTFTCDDLGVQLVQIWVTDEFGNQDYVITFIDVQDNNIPSACPGPDPGAQGLIAGQVSTEMTDNVEEVAVVLEGSEFNEELTDNQGIYSFPAMGFGGSYTVRPEKNDDYLNGVNVLDLVLIQKHILGLEQLNTPNKLIAADADDNNVVSAQDIIEIRKLILGLTAEYNNNDSWRFIDGNFSFQTSNPLTESYPEFISVNEFSQSLPNINFTGIKIGDVNDDVVANNLNVTEDRSNDELALEMEDASFTKGSVVSVDVRSENFNNILAYQFTLNTAAALDLQSVVPGKLDMGMDNFGLFNDGIITTAWNATAAMNAESNDVLFTLVFKANTSGQLSDFFEIGSTVTTANAYSDLEKLGVSLNFSGNATVTSAPDFTLNQNTPNPFGQMTEISFVLPEQSDAVFSVFDVNGKLVYSNQGSFDKGFNKISLEADQLGESGVYYYQIDSKGFTATKKMILVK